MDSGANGGTIAFPSLGKHCSHDLCQLLDFLPFDCDACQQVRRLFRSIALACLVTPLLQREIDVPRRFSVLSIAHTRRTHAVTFTRRT